MKRYAIALTMTLNSLCASSQGKSPFAADVRFYQDSLNPMKVHATVSVCVHYFWPFNGQYIEIFWGDSGNISYGVAPADTSSLWGFGNSLALDSLQLGVMHFYAEHTFPDSLPDSIVYQEIYIDQRLLGILNVNVCGNGNEPVDMSIVSSINLNYLRNHTNMASPIFEAPPCTPSDTIFKPLQYDPLLTGEAGDSLIIVLDTPRHSLTQYVPCYLFPNAYDTTATLTPDTFVMDSLTGILTWRSPQFGGYYDVAFNATEYDHGRFVCSVERDMLFEIAFPVGAGIASLANSGFNISPNPANTSIEIELQNVEKNSMELTLRNVSGQLLSQQTISPATKTELDVSNLSSGMYFIHLQDGQQSWVQKFVKE